jgi:hypothetical protein
MAPFGCAELDGQDNVTSGNVDESAASEKTNAIGAISVPDVMGPSRPSIFHVYTSAGRDKRKFRNIRQKENEINDFIIGDLGQTVDNIRASLGHVDVSKKASSKMY